MLVACAAGPTPCRTVQPWDRETEAWRQRLLHRRRGRSVPSLGRGSGTRPTVAPVAADGSREQQDSGWFSSETQGRRRSPRCPLQPADSGCYRHPSPRPALAAPRPPVPEPLGTSANTAAGLGCALRAEYQLKGVCRSGRRWPLGKGEMVAVTQRAARSICPQPGGGGTGRVGVPRTGLSLTPVTVLRDGREVTADGTRGWRGAAGPSANGRGCWGLCSGPGPALTSVGAWQR